MRKARFPFLKTFVLVFGVLLLAANVAFAQVPVTVQNVVGKAGTTKAIAVNVGDLTGLQVISYQFTLRYDTSVMRVTGYSTTGTLSSGMENVSVVFATPGVVYVGALGTQALAGSGTLLTLTASLTAPGTSALTVSNFLFNNGTPAATVTNGTATVPTLSVNLPIASGVDTVYLHRTLNFSVPITTEDITGKHVIAFQCIVTFDPTVLKIYGVDPAGTLTAAWQTFAVDTTTSGQIEIAAAGSSELTGAGTLINLKARAINSGTADVAFKNGNFLYNAGNPAVGAIDGNVNIFISTVGITKWDNVPTSYGLGQNYPNPFNPSTMISFSLPKEENVTLEVYNILGMKVRTLIAGQRMGAATYSVDWNGKDNLGMTVPSGIYLYRIHAGQFDAAKKMVLMK